MKYVFAIFAPALIAGCSGGVPDCSSSKTKDLALQIITQQLEQSFNAHKGQMVSMATSYGLKFDEDYSSIKFELDNTSISDKNEKTESYHNKIITHPENKLGEYLQKEFQIGMQTIMAACIAMDAYYASVKEFADIPEEVSKKWRENGTARYKQISETLKRVFVIPQDIFLQIRETIKQGFELRDRAVHPKSGTDLPVVHPEANVLSDWRFSTFRYVNAKAVVGNMLSIIYQTSRKEIPDAKASLKVTTEKHKKEIDPILKKWIKRYGKLFD